MSSSDPIHAVDRYLMVVIAAAVLATIASVFLPRWWAVTILAVAAATCVVSLVCVQVHAHRERRERRERRVPARYHVSDDD